MGFHGKHYNAVGKDPDFGAIFMSNSGTRRECIRKGLFGLPSSEIEFVDKVKAGMILFLFEYEKRQLHGVFKATSDGAINIIPNAFSSLRKQFPAQVKFIPIWHCKPLPERVFRDAIRENYFSASKFNFGLSEKQVHKLLHLFSMRKLEMEVPGRQLIMMKDLKSESQPMGKVGRSVDLGRHAESVGDGQGVSASNSPLRRHHKFRDSIQYYGGGENFGFNASRENKQGRVAELAVDARSRYIGDYLDLQDEFGYATREKEHYMDIHLRTALSGGFPRSPSGKFGVRGDSEFSMSHRLCEDLRNNGQRMLFSDDNPCLHDSDVNQSLFYGKPILENNSFVQNQLRPTSAKIQPIEARIARDSSVTHGDVGSKSTLLYDPDYAVRSPNLGHNSLAQNNLRPTSAMIDPNNSCLTRGGSGSKSSVLYDPDYLGLNFSYSSPVRINNDSMSLLESAYLSNNCRRNSLSNQTCLISTELNGMKRCHDVSYDSLNHGLYRSDENNPLNMDRNADFLAAESVVYEAPGGIPALNSSSVLVPASDIGNSDRVHEPFSSLFYNCKSQVCNDDHPIALGANLRHEMALEKNYRSFTPDVPWAIEGYSQVQYGDPLVYEFDSECHGNSQNAIPGYLKKKSSSVFSRLTFMQDVKKKQENGSKATREDVKKKQENGNKATREWYGVKASVDEVMEMVHQSHGQWMPKRKPKPLVKHGQTESLRDKSQIISSNIKSDCFENIMNDTSMDLDATSGGNTSEPPKEICFVDFKRRSKVRKLDHESEIRSSNESVKSENVGLVPQKRRKLIRPNFSKNATPDYRGIDLGMPQNLQVSLSLEGSNLNHAGENGHVLAQNEDSHKTEAEGRKFICQTHSEENIGHARGSACDGGVKARDCILPAGNDESKFLESINNQNASSSYCKDKNPHIQKGLQVIDGVNSIALEVELLHPICQNHHGVDAVMCADKGNKIEGGLLNDSAFSGAIEVKGGSVCNGGVKARDCILPAGNEDSKFLESINNQNAASSYSKDKNPHIQKGLQMIDGVNSIPLETESLHPICQNHHGVDVVICADRGDKIEGGLSNDSNISGVIEVKDGSDSFQKSGHDNDSNETSCHFNEALCVMDRMKSVSQDKESLHSSCQEHDADKIVCAGKGIIPEEEMPKDGAFSFTIEGKRRSECKKNSGHEKAQSETSKHCKEASRVINSKKSPDSEALLSKCQEHHSKIICSGRGIDTEKEMARGGDLVFTIDDGSDLSQKSGDENGPIATSFHSKEGTNMDTKQMNLTCQERHDGGVAYEEMSKDGSSSLTSEVADGSTTVY